MTEIRLDPPAPSTIDALYAAYEQRAAAPAAGSDDDWRRDHLGVSIIGHECDRYLWLSFRWAANPKHSGKQLRLFKRGKIEEQWIIEDLRAAGIIVRDRSPEGEQFRMRFGPHVGGSVDGLVTGLLEAPETEHVLEVKTHNAKSFAWLQKNGLKRGKPMHYAQVQVYMRGMNLERAIYIAVCKDTDEIYVERVHIDRKFADAMIAKGQAIVAMYSPPDRKDKANPPCMLTSKDGTQWPCQFYEVCHGKQMPEKNCRTCVSCESDIIDSSSEMWCTHRCEALTSTLQRMGCSEHVTIPPMVNAQVVDVDEEKRTVRYQFADGSVVEDGAG